MDHTYQAALQKLVELQSRFGEFHPLFQQAYPVAIVEGDQFHIYDVGADGSYARVRVAPTPMPIPAGVRAAFDLEAYNQRIACVVTGEVFDEPGGYVTLLHEFVHCYQANTCELRLKQTLEIARQAMAAGDYMWELEYPFPYDHPDFVTAYTTLFSAVESADLAGIIPSRSRLTTLPPDALEYLHWQEWKEGFARFIENRLRQALNLPINHYGRQQPYHRISLYEGGAVWIDFLVRREPALLLDLEALFQRMGIQGAAAPPKNGGYYS